MSYGENLVLGAARKVVEAYDNGDIEFCTHRGEEVMQEFSKALSTLDNHEQVVLPIEKTAKQATAR